MGYPTTERVLLHGPRAHAMRLMLVAMSTYADDKTGDRIRPSMKTLVTKSGLNAGHANRTIRRLLAEGWIEVVGERSKGGSKSAVTEYRICLERLQGECAAQPLRSAPPAHAHYDPLRSARADPAQRTGTPCAAHTDPSDTRLKNPPPPISEAAAKRGGGGGGSAAPETPKPEPPAAGPKSNGVRHRPGDQVPLPNGAHPPKRDPAAEARAATLTALEQAGIDDAAERSRLADLDGVTAPRVKTWASALAPETKPAARAAWIAGEAGKVALQLAAANERLAAKKREQGIEPAHRAGKGRR